MLIIYQYNVCLRSPTDNSQVLLSVKLETDRLVRILHFIVRHIPPISSPIIVITIMQTKRQYFLV